uniref:C2H2-type domain-containing protein n=1 Tax=Aureoumbra lagunensis TaxID=44058 RepID=A0A7S3NJM4_9STRA|mmetsp:Transcript_7937/g.11072  ORF Transcript_7937/g.11072 Transcript_7937/m.11072 type:complete len:399 (+) Transcript_7937:84-1280(+)|eukprot:CAMPEP_0197314660 /NCGR_PEP_ID=MMETSP0891-20130614/34880_1 /TAXON_ID=44058 ORGANISM="Aureoumbra lagunensis, Strain CCMP1510" /NCGR_SAMPLE_ID=MMETSP0891 /ASSEMBLY_ACC=CAM_ASM_000534 /LENGTH=398 /DNA_ID=CAMNT_0042803217 /DNA_START=72 /DNA_END=1268 /DNA_ORIENTATION=-
MSRRTSTPQNVVKLSNVAVVRLQRGGSRFEVACYPNKVVDYRNGIESDLDEVLQVRQVFKNASKGQVASKKEVEKAFGVVQAACEEILKFGELQISEKERGAKIEALSKDISQIVAEKIIEANSGRPVPASQIEKIMQNLKFTVSTSRSSKQQALDLIRCIENESELGLARAKMRLKIVNDSHAAREALLAIDGIVTDGTTFLAEPRVFRAASAAVEAQGTSIQVIDHAARVAISEITATEKKSSSPQQQQEESMTHNKHNQNFSQQDQEENKPHQGKKSKAAKRREKEDYAERLALVKEAQERRQKHREHLESSDNITQDSSATTENDDKGKDQSSNGGKLLTCNTCGGSFSDTAAHRCHFRSDWHRYNLKRKLENKPPISEADFDDLDLLLSTGAA